MANVNNGLPDGTISITNNSLFGTTYQWYNSEGKLLSSDRVPEIRFPNYGENSLTLVVTNAEGCSDTLTQLLDVQLFSGLYIPNAFMPTIGPEGTRVFRPVGVGLSEYSIAVYDKWGNRVFESTKLENGIPTETWDGTWNGKELAQGAYVWVAQATYLTGKFWVGQSYTPTGKKLKTGTVTIIR